MRFKRKEPEEIFLEDITTLIKNLLIENVNYENGYYLTGNGRHALLDDTKRNAQYILDRIEQTKHLIVDKDEE